MLCIKATRTVITPLQDYLCFFVFFFGGGGGLFIKWVLHTSGQMDTFLSEQDTFVRRGKQDQSCYIKKEEIHVMGLIG